MSEVATTTTAVTQKEFAARRGVSEAMVSRWKAKGRIVLDAEGRVCVDESNALLERTLDPARGGDRTGKPRAPHLSAVIAADNAGRGDGVAKGETSRGEYHDAATDEKRERAAILRLERMELEGKLIFRDQVEREAQSRATAARDALVAMSDRLAPLLAAESDVGKIRALLDAEVRHIAAQLSARAPVEAVA